MAARVRFVGGVDKIWLPTYLGLTESSTQNSSSINQNLREPAPLGFGVHTALRELESAGERERVQVEVDLFVSDNGFLLLFISIRENGVGNLLWYNSYAYDNGWRSSCDMQL